MDFINCEPPTVWDVAASKTSQSLEFQGLCRCGVRNLPDWASRTQAAGNRKRCESNQRRTEKSDRVRVSSAHVSGMEIRSASKGKEARKVGDLLLENQARAAEVLGNCVAALLVLGVIILSPLQVAEDIEAGLTRAKKHRTNTTSYTNCCKWIILCHHTHPRVGSFCRNKFGPFHFYIHPKVGGPSWLQ